MRPDRKQILGWAFYDWADSAFATTVMAGFFPVFFKQYWSAGTDVNASTAQLAFGNSIASLLVALVAPVLGAMADRGGAKKRFLASFAYLGAAMTAALFLVPQGAWSYAIVIYAFALIGFSGSNIFYDALLPAVAGPERRDRVSAFGYALGYLGGGLLFLINVAMTLRPEAFGLADRAAAVRWSFLTVAVWWGGFTLVTLRLVREERRTLAGLAIAGAVRDGIRRLLTTLRAARQLKQAFLFLAAYWLYIDGVDTVIRLAVDYGLSLGLGERDLIVALLITQFVGFPAAILYAKLGERWGVRRAIFLAIGIYGAVTLGAMGMRSAAEFYILAVAVGLVQGGIQALSRSYFARLIPAGRAGEFYGLYNMLGKFAAIIGPALVGATGLIVKAMLAPENSGDAGELLAASRQASRWGIASILILFAAGALLFYAVDEKRGREDAERMEAAERAAAPSA